MRTPDPLRAALGGLALILLAFLAPPAAAGTYEVRACDQAGINRAFTPAGSSLVAADASCSADWSLGMKVRNQVGRGTLPAFTWGALEAQAPPGTLITAIRAQGTAFGTRASGFSAGGWEAGVADDSGYRWCGLPSGCMWAGPPALPMSVDGLATTRLRLMVICSSGSGCSTGNVQAATTLRDVVLELRDDEPPAIGAASGALASGDWVSGRVPAGFAASDTTGIRRSSLELDGRVVAASEPGCDPYSMRPCPNAGPDGAIDTTRLADGTHELAATAFDAAGNRAAMSRTLRVDNSSPAAPRVGRPGWTNEAGPVAVEIASGGSGPSGVASFLASVDGGEPLRLTASPDGTAQLVAGPLSEGRHPVRVRATSGAGVEGTAGEGFVGIDRSAPQVEVDLAGGSRGRQDWVRGPAEVSVSGTDQPELSGMAPAPEGEPVESGGYVEYQVDSQEPVRVRGASARFSFDTDGTHAVSARAVDAAGNPGRARTTSFRVDSRVPSGTLERPDADDPRRLRALVQEGCVASVALELRPAGDGGWESVDGRADEGRVSALVPDDRLPGGRYEARFRVVDCAGNEGLITSFADGSAGFLKLPLRMRPRITAALLDAGGRESGTVTTGIRREVALTARLVDDRDEPMAGAAMEVRTRVGSGPWRTVARGATGQDGRFEGRVPPGPSRSVQVVAPDTRLSTGASSREMLVRVPARATIRVARRHLRNGQAARFSGRLLGGFLPARGREIELQGYNPARGRWQPVLTEGLRCDGRGRWRARYRFSATVGGTVAYRFRVRVAPRPDHPFAEGHSRPVTVKVSG